MVSVLYANVTIILNLFVQQKTNKNIKAMRTNFEKLNEQEMINVVGGDQVIRVTDSDGSVYYIIIRDGRKN
jgi:bacteriocin-type signal sequence